MNVVLVQCLSVKMLVYKNMNLMPLHVYIIINYEGYFIFECGVDCGS